MAIPLLLWQSTIVGQELLSGKEAIPKWFKIIKDIMLHSKLNLKNVKINKSDVNGTTNDTIVAVTMVQFDDVKCMAIVMAAGNQAAECVKVLIWHINQVKVTPLDD
jgi:hypothetical protein